MPCGSLSGRHPLLKLNTCAFTPTPLSSRESSRRLAENPPSPKKTTFNGSLPTRPASSGQGRQGHQPFRTQSSNMSRTNLSRPTVPAAVSSQLRTSSSRLSSAPRPTPANRSVPSGDDFLDDIDPDAFQDQVLSLLWMLIFFF